MEEMIIGADISTLDQIEDFGGKFYDGGILRPADDILKDCGFNYVRLKLWNDPGLPNSDPKGYNNLEHVIKMSKRVKEKGFKLLLDFHYSDFWADPQVQTKPQSWKDLSFDGLKGAVYAYTRKVILALKANGCLPDMVQVGNEITNGFLWDEGKLDGLKATDEQWDRFSALLRSGIRGVKEALEPHEAVKIMIHIDKGGDFEVSKYFFDSILQRGVDFDVIGQSFYCQWQGTLNDLESTLYQLIMTYDKEVIIVETAHPWTPKSDSKTPNKVTLEAKGYPASIEGQVRFIRDILSIIQRAPGHKATGLFYWEPAFITVEGCGWKYGEGNEWGNMTLFDFQGRLLDSAREFKRFNLS